MADNNSGSSYPVTATLPPRSAGSQMSATILYQLLQNISQDNTNLKVSTPSTKEALHHSIDEFTVRKEDNAGPNSRATFSNNDSCILTKYISLTASESMKMNPKKRLLQRHLIEKSFEERNNSRKIETSSRDSTKNAPFGRAKNGKPLTRSPFVPSYMDPKSGPFWCKVCGHKASGLHYRVMACEGCKGFFRRSVQKNLKYLCKMNNNCKINSDNRTKCQQCRWNMCVAAGMDTSSVLNEDERRTKNDLIRANRYRKKQEIDSAHFSNTSCGTSDPSDSVEKVRSDGHLKGVLETIILVSRAFEMAFVKDQENVESVTSIQGIQIGKEFTKRVTTFAQLLPDMGQTSEVALSALLQLRCLDVICLCTAFTYDVGEQRLKLPSGRQIDAAYVEKYKHLEPLWAFATRTAEYRLGRSEKAVLAGLALLVNGGQRPRDDADSASSTEAIYNRLLAALDYLMAGQPLRNSKLLIVVFSDLQVLTRRLFELRAPLGHQLLFDMDPATLTAEWTTKTEPQQTTPCLDHVDDDLSRTSTPHSISIPTSTISSPSIFAFSYGDKQL